MLRDMRRISRRGRPAVAGRLSGQTRSAEPDEMDCDARLRIWRIGSADAVVMIRRALGVVGPAVSIRWSSGSTRRVNALAGSTSPGRASSQCRCPTSTAAKAPPGSDEPIAVIGLGCRFPGGDRGPGCVVAVPVDGRCGIGTVPEGRWARFRRARRLRRRRWPRRPGGARFLTTSASLRRGVLRDPGGGSRQDGPPAAVAAGGAWEALEHAGIRADIVAPQRRPGCSPEPASAEYGYLAHRAI